MIEDRENLHTFNEAVVFLKDHEIDYEVRINERQGALMTREIWLECVANKSFIDYDGDGCEVTADGNLLAGCIKPSQAAQINPEARYILWFNR